MGEQEKVHLGCQVKLSTFFKKLKLFDLNTSTIFPGTFRRPNGITDFTVRNDNMHDKEMKDPELTQFSSHKYGKPSETVPIFWDL